MADFDPFDSPWESDSNYMGKSEAPDLNPTGDAQSTDDEGEVLKKRKVGRPRIRPIREKGPVGRPRIRPIEAGAKRGPGRPRRDTSAVADKIYKQSVVSGTYGAKSVAQGLKGVDKSIEIFNRGVVTPLSNVVNKFAEGVRGFNRYHQSYLKDQVYLARNMADTFDDFRKIAIDPALRGMSVYNKNAREFARAFEQLNSSSSLRNDPQFKKINDSVQIHASTVNKLTKTGVAWVEASNKFLKDYHDTSKGTAKFLNAVTYTIDDVAEDIANLRQDLTRYLSKGKRSVIVDQSETLKKIEKNTKSPSIARRMVASMATMTIAGIKTLIRYNRVGFTDFLINALETKVLKTEGSGKRKGEREKGDFERAMEKVSEWLSPKREGLNEIPKTLSGKFAKLIRDTVDIEIGRLVRDEEGNLQVSATNNYERYLQGDKKAGRAATRRGAKQTFIDMATSIDNSEFVKNIKEDVRKIADKIEAAPIKFQEKTNKLARDFEESKTGKTTKYTIKAGAQILTNWLKAEDAKGRRGVTSTMTRYGAKRYRGPHGNADKRIQTLDERLIKVLEDYQKDLKYMDEGITIKSWGAQAKAENERLFNSLKNMLNFKVEDPYTRPPGNPNFGNIINFKKPKKGNGGDLGEDVWDYTYGNTAFRFPDEKRPNLRVVDSATSNIKDFIPREFRETNRSFEEIERLAAKKALEEGNKKSINERLKDLTTNTINNISGIKQSAAETINKIILASKPLFNKVENTTKPLFGKLQSLTSPAFQKAKDVYYHFRDKNKYEGQEERKSRNTNWITKIYGQGKQVSLDPQSESTINTANMSTPAKALSSIARINARIMGYMKKTWDKSKKDSLKTKLDPGGLSDLMKYLLGGAGVFGAGALMKSRKLFRKGGILHGLRSAAFAPGRFLQGLKGIKGAKTGMAKTAGATSRVLWDTFGWGSVRNAKDTAKEAAKIQGKLKDLGQAWTRAKQAGDTAAADRYKQRFLKESAKYKHWDKARKGGTNALNMFKSSWLGQSRLGTWIRQMRLASAGYGTSLGSRLGGALTGWTKWGGGVDPLSIGNGIWQAAKNRKGMPIMANTPEAIRKYGQAAKAGSGLRQAWQAEHGTLLGRLFPTYSKMFGKIAEAAKPITAVGGTAVKGLFNTAKTALAMPGEFFANISKGARATREAAHMNQEELKAVLKEKYGHTKTGRAIRRNVGKTIRSNRLTNFLSILAEDAKHAVGQNIARIKYGKTQAAKRVRGTVAALHQHEMNQLGDVGKGILKAEKFGTKIKGKVVGAVGKAGEFVGKNFTKAELAVTKSLTALGAKVPWLTKAVGVVIRPLKVLGKVFGPLIIGIDGFFGAIRTTGNLFDKFRGVLANIVAGLTSMVGFFTNLVPELVSKIPFLKDNKKVQEWIEQQRDNKMTDLDYKSRAGSLFGLHAKVGKNGKIGYETLKDAGLSYSENMANAGYKQHYNEGEGYTRKAKQPKLENKSTPNIFQRIDNKAKQSGGFVYNGLRSGAKAIKNTFAPKSNQANQNNWFTNWMHDIRQELPGGKRDSLDPNKDKQRRDWLERNRRAQMGDPRNTGGSATNYIASAQKNQEGLFAKATVPTMPGKEGSATKPIIVDVLGKVKKGVKKGVKSAVQGIKELKQTYIDTEKVNTSGKWVDTNSGAISWGPEAVRDGMAQPFMNKFGPAAEKFFKDKGKPVKVTSARRTNTKQAQLFVRGRILKEPGIYTPAAPAWTEDVNVRGKTYRVQGTGQTMRSGHMGGAAVDVDNWKEFLPYARGAGLHWMGMSDPVHFQIDQKFPVPKPKSATQIAQAPKGNNGKTNKVNPPAASSKMGDPASAATRPMTNGGGGTSKQHTQINGGTEELQISPMVQDYGLAIINNLLFSS